MSADTLRWKTLEALKNSPKGKLKSDPYWLERGEDILAGYNESVSLSPLSGVILKRLGSGGLLQSSSSSSSSSSESSPGLAQVSPLPSSSPEIVGEDTASSAAATFSNLDHEQVTDERKEKDPVVDVTSVSSPAPPPTISLLSPRATETAGCIQICEEKHREKAKMALRLREELQEQLVASVASLQSEQLKRFDELMELKHRQEYQSMKDMMNRETQESIGRQEKLREEHQRRLKIMNLRLREAEVERQRQAEFERQRQAEGRERLRNLNTIQEEILQLNQLLVQTGNTPADLTSYSTRGNQLCSQVSEVVRKRNEREYPSMEDMTVAEQALQEMRDLIQVMQEEVAKAQEKKKKLELEEEEKRKKQEELKAQQEAQKKTAAASAKEKVQSKGLQTRSEEGTLKWYKELQDSATQCVQSFEELNSSKETKKLKAVLQKAATIPVSQISSTSGSQLREIFDKMDKLLSGRNVVSGGLSVSISLHPKALDFISYKLAEKFVNQGEVEVASHHEAAFPIAVVASGVWELHPRVGDLILAHLHKKCPYAVPHYPAMKDGTPVEEYQRLLGYCVNDSGVEGQHSFLKRMSGMIRLYAAVIQLRWPYNSKQGSSPHGLNHGWRWLAQMLNMEPLVDVTATLLFDFLEVCGHALMKQYQAQFWKLILLLKDEYLPRIDAVTSSVEMGSVKRLKDFLETSLQSRQMSPPKGQLTSMFWRT